jgi:hypothetical protein
MTDNAGYLTQPFRRRTRMRERLPFFALWLAPKGEDCVANGGRHQWYNQDGNHSACYHCRVVKEGQLWNNCGAGADD